MSRLLPGLALLLPLVVIGVAAPHAHADFYGLDGQYQCFEKPSPACAEGSRLLAAPALDKPAIPVVKPEDDAARPAARPAALSKTPDGVLSPAVTRPPYHPPSDPVHDIAMRIEAGTATPDDLHRLHALANAGNGSATELLAWCDYTGVGTPRDPIAAYLLYAAAASEGVPHARANEAAIYEGVLTSDQRQQVLDVQDNGIALNAVR